RGARRRSEVRMIGSRKAGALTMCILSAALPLPGALPAQGGVMIQGIADAEAWSTDAKSNLLTRNNGSLGGLGRLTLWTAVEPIPRFVVFAQGELTGGNALPGAVTTHSDVELEQAGIRWSTRESF